MRRYFLILIITIYGGVLQAQSSKIDSLRNLLQSQKQDSNRVNLLWKLAEQYQFFKPDTTLQLAQEALLLARHIKYTEGESRSLAIMATGQYLLGNYSSALNNYMNKLQIEEKRNSIRNYASALNNIGLMYILLADYPRALNYLYRADSTVQVAGGAVKIELENRILVNLGETFYRMKNTDSANHYFNKALRVGISKQDGFYQGASLLGLGNVKSASGNDSAAMRSYRSALQFLNDGTNNDMLCETAQGLANVFQKTGLMDSALYYARLALNIGKNDGFLSRELDAAGFLSLYYKKQNKFDSAFTYMEQSVILQDSLKGQAKTREAMIISSNEQLRQAELGEQRQQEQQTRIQQLQILAICIFIPAFFILTLTISRVRIRKGIVRFMGVVSLLLIFEFLILLLHPRIVVLTHHNIILELLILVVIGTGLVPLHHKLEHLLIAKLTKARLIKQPNHDVTDLKDFQEAANIPHAIKAEPVSSQAAIDNSTQKKSASERKDTEADKLDIDP